MVHTTVRVYRSWNRLPPGSYSTSLSFGQSVYYLRENWSVHCVNAFIKTCPALIKTYADKLLQWCKQSSITVSAQHNFTPTSISYNNVTALFHCKSPKSWLHTVYCRWSYPKEISYASQHLNFCGSSQWRVLNYFNNLRLFSIIFPFHRIRPTMQRSIPKFSPSWNQ